MSAAAADGPPLARLFAIAYRRLVDDLHDRLRERGWGDVRPAFGFVLLAVRDEPLTSTELAQRLETSKQATSKLVDAMEVAGYVERRVGADDLRRRPVALTRRGRRLLAAVEEIYRELEEEWSHVVGAAPLQQMRRTLVQVLAEPGPEGSLPVVRPPA